MHQLAPLYLGPSPVKWTHGFPSLNLFTYSCFLSIQSKIVQPISTQSSGTVTSNPNHWVVFWSSKNWVKVFRKCISVAICLRKKCVGTRRLWGANIRIATQFSTKISNLKGFMTAWENIRTYCLAYYLHFGQLSLVQGTGELRINWIRSKLENKCLWLISF